MRVLFWSELFWPHIGGAENGGLELILSLRQRGHEFIVVTRQDNLTQPTVEEYEGVRIYRFPFWKAYADRNLQQLLEARKGVRKLKHEFSPDLVHIHNLGPSSLFYLETTKVHPVPLLVTLTAGNFEKDVGFQLLENILRSADWVTAKSKAILKSACQLVPQIGLRASVIYRGRSDLLPHRISSPTILQRILCVGRLSTEKGFDLALSALAAIVGQFPAVEMVIVGDGAARSSLEQQAESLGLTDKVKFLGWVIPEKVPALLATAHLVMIPSRYEGVPRVAVEAALMAKPVVATRVGGIPEVVLHQKTGLLVEAENSAALAEATSFLLVHHEKATTMGDTARMFASKKFNMEHFVDSYQALYQQLTLEKSA